MKLIIRILFFSYIFFITYSTGFALSSRHFSYQVEDDPLRKRYSASAQSGILYGRLYEYVYTGNRKLSELDWDVKPLVYTGITGGLEYKRFEVSLGFWIGINKDLGTMEDFDWNDPNGAWTNYSKHDNKLDKAYFFDIAGSYTFNCSSALKIIPVLGYRQIFVKMEATDGYLQYPPGSAKVPVSGVGIIYEQKYDIPFLGIESVYLVSSAFNIKAWFHFSPFTEVTAVDVHVFRDLEFHDSVTGALYFNPGLSATWLISSRVQLSITAAYHYVPETKGDEYIIDLSTGIVYSTPPDSIGIEMRLAESKIAVHYRW